MTVMSCRQHLRDSQSAEDRRSRLLAYVVTYFNETNHPRPRLF